MTNIYKVVWFKVLHEVKRGIGANNVSDIVHQAGVRAHQQVFDSVQRSVLLIVSSNLRVKTPKADGEVSNRP